MSNFLNFLKKHWEIMKINNFSLIFDEKTWIFMIS